MLIYLASPRPEAWREFRDGLGQEPGTEVALAETGAEVLAMARTRTPALVIVDNQLPDFKPFGLVLEIIKVNAMVQTAVVSELSEEEFHEQSEGLGIMAHISPDLSAGEAGKLMDLLKILM
jgi:DNA-binding response OmpR family regulator